MFFRTVFGLKDMFKLVFFLQPPCKQAAVTKVQKGNLVTVHQPLSPSAPVHQRKHKLNQSQTTEPATAEPDEMPASKRKATSPVSMTNSSENDEVRDIMMSCSSGDQVMPSATKEKKGINETSLNYSEHGRTLKIFHRFQNCKEEQADGECELC